jgi:hypothetical protein
MPGPRRSPDDQQLRRRLALERELHACRRPRSGRRCARSRRPRWRCASGPGVEAEQRGDLARALARQHDVLLDAERDGEDARDAHAWPACAPRTTSTWRRRGRGVVAVQRRRRSAPGRATASPGSGSRSQRVSCRPSAGRAAPRRPRVRTPAPCASRARRCRCARPGCAPRLAAAPRSRDVADPRSAPRRARSSSATAAAAPRVARSAACSGLDHLAPGRAGARATRTALAPRRPRRHRARAEAVDDQSSDAAPRLRATTPRRRRTHGLAGLGHADGADVAVGEAASPAPPTAGQRSTRACPGCE